MTHPALEELLDALDVEFDDPALLARALTHRSYAFEEGGLPTNERLEFLGDAVIALVVTDEIFHSHPDEAEGRLAKLRAAAVKTATLADIARGLELGRHVRLGRGEAASGGGDKDSILADTFEAVVGAYYLDQDFTAAERLLRRLYRDRLEELSSRDAALDFKTSLQELAAARFDSLPHYEVTGDGPDHERVFSATVSVDGREVGAGTGSSKKRAEQRAAREAYRRLTNTGPT